MDTNISGYTIDEEAQTYLGGASFSSGFRFRVSKSENKLLFKTTLLEKLVKGKKIVHLGCTDHLEEIDERIRANIHLHKRLTAIASQCLGIDINKDAIKYLADKYGLRNIIYGDMIKDRIPHVVNTKWDYLVVPDVLEHMDDPYLFLKTIKAEYANCIGKLIISVPNAFQIQSFFHLLNHNEPVNSDHRYTFTPYTLFKIITRAGMSVERYYLCKSGESMRKRFFMVKYFLKKFPAFRTTIVAEVRI